MKKILELLIFVLIIIGGINAAFLVLWSKADYRLDGQDPYADIIKPALDNYEDKITVVSKGEQDIWQELEQAKEKSDYSTVNVEMIINEFDIRLNFTGIKVSRIGFNYNSDFKIMKACENDAYTARLNAEESKTLGQIRLAVSKIIDDNMTDEQKVKAIHDYIVSEYEYRVYDGSAESLPKEYFSISGMFENKKGVCEAYGDMFRAMCLCAGLECEEATGVVDGVSHLWNLVKIDGEYRHFDATFDDPVPDVKGRIQYYYYNVSEEDMRARRHTYQIVCN